MIMINCCYTCRWYKNDKCVNLDQWNPPADPNESCEDWKAHETKVDNFTTSIQRTTATIKKLKEAL